MKRILGLMLGTTTLIGCNANPVVDPPVLAACPSTITISTSSNVYTTTSCSLKIGTPITIQARTGHPLSGSGAGRAIWSATTDQNIGFTVEGKFDFQCDFHGAGGMKGSITVIP